MSAADMESPCIKVCAVGGQSGLCVGCGRTLAEIAAWSRLDARERRAVLAQLPGRLAALEQPRCER